MSSTPQPSPAIQRAYRQLIGRLADLESDSGWPIDIDLAKAAGPLTRDELAAVCEMHRQAVTDEFAVNPQILAAYLRSDIDVLELVSHIREVTEFAVWEAIRTDVLEECADRALLREIHAGERQSRESAESAHGMGRTFL